MPSPTSDASPPAQHDRFASVRAQCSATRSPDVSRLSSREPLRWIRPLSMRPEMSALRFDVADGSDVASWSTATMTPDANSAWRWSRRRVRFDSATAHAQRMRSSSMDARPQSATTAPSSSR